MSKNVDYAKIETSIVKGDTFDETYSVTLNGVAFDMTDKQIDISIRNGGDIKTWSSAGTSPAISISSSQFAIYDATWDPSSGNYNGWVRNTTDDYVIAKIIIVIEK